MKKSELRELSVKELRQIVRDNQLPIVGAWKMKKDDLVENIFSEVYEMWGMVDDETPEPIVEEETKPQRRGGRARVIEVYKDGQLVTTITGLIETFKWAVENNICNQGWVKNSLRTGKETVPGRKFKQGGYLFKYAD